MPQPTSSDVLVNVPLSQVSLAFIQDLGDAFVADKVFPVVPVEKQGGLYLSYERNDWLRDEAEERAAGTPSAGGGYNVDFNSSYFARVYAFHKDVDDPTRANAKGYMDMDRDATLFVTRKLLLKREVVWATNYFGSGIWTTDLTGTTNFVKWSSAGSTPIEDIENQKVVVAALTGFKPNTIVMTPDVLAVLKNHPEILDRVKYTQRGILDEELLAAVFGVDKVLVPYGIKATNAEGGTKAYGFVLGSKKLLLCYAAPNPGLLVPSAGYTFSWTGYLGAGAAGNVIRTFRMDSLRSDRIEGEIAFDLKVVAADLGVMFNACIV